MLNFKYLRYVSQYNRAMLDACFSHLHFCQSLHTPQRGLSAIADLLVIGHDVHVP